MTDPQKPLESPPEWEGDDSINVPEGLKPVKEEDLEDTVELEDDDDDDA